MSILRTYEEALLSLTPFLQKEIEKESLKYTLNYIYNIISHKCYAIAIDSQNIHLFSLFPSNTSPIFDKWLREEAKNCISPNLEERHKRHIHTFITNKKESLRLMQCIVKPFVFPSSPSPSPEYTAFFKKLRGVKIGVYIISLTDACILREDGRFPFELPMCKRKTSERRKTSEKVVDPYKLLPILSLSGKRGFLDQPIPNYDDIEITYHKNIKELQNHYHLEWREKNKNTAVFRGGPTGCGYTPETNQRLALLQLSRERPDLFNVGLVASGKFIDSYSIKVDPIHGLGMLNTGWRSTERLTYKEQSMHKYIIHVDGNVAAYRLLSTMLLGSLILRVESDYQLWSDLDLWKDSGLQPNKHYLSIRSDLSNLISTIEWCRENDKECAKIAATGLKTAMKLLSPEYIEKYTATLMNRTMVQYRRMIIQNRKLQHKSIARLSNKKHSL